MRPIATDRARGGVRTNGAVVAALLALAAAVFVFARSRQGAENAEPVPPARDVSLATARENAGDVELAATAEREPRRVVDAPAQPAAKREPEPAVLFWCRVIADEDGAALPGARVTLEGWLAESVSDAHGLFSWPVEPNRVQRLCVRMPGRAVRFVTANPRHAQPEVARELRMSLGSAIDARIFGPLDFVEGGLRLQADVPSSAVHDLDDQSPAARSEQVSAAFSSDGRALLAELPSRAALALAIVRVDGSTLASLGELVLEPGETRVLHVELGPPARLSVRVVDQYGELVRGQSLWLVRQPETASASADACYLQFGDVAFDRRTTDAAGTAVFEAVPPGTWWLGPAKEDFDAARAAELVAALATRIEVEPTPAQGLTLAVHRGLYLRGRIVDASGAAVARAFVGCEHESIGGYVTGDVRADGAFELGPVAAGVHLVRAIPQGVYLPPEPVRAEAGGPEIVITLARGGVLSGRVFDATGAPARADLTCSLAGGAGPTLASIGDDGLFRFSGLEPGSYVVVACTRDGRAGLVAGVALGEEGVRDDVRIELHPAARLRIRSSGGPELAALTIRIAGAVVFVEELPRGVQRELSVPAGALAISLSLRDTPAHVRTVEARPGESTEVVFELD